MEASVDPEIRPVRTRSERRVFVKMAWEVYREYPNWVPPLIGEQLRFLDPRRGVFFEHGEAALFVARRQGRAVYRKELR